MDSIKLCAQSPLSCTVHAACSVSVKYWSNLKTHCALIDTIIHTYAHNVMVESETGLYSIENLEMTACLLVWYQELVLRWRVYQKIWQLKKKSQQKGPVFQRSYEICLTYSLLSRARLVIDPSFVCPKCLT